MDSRAPLDPAVMDATVAARWSRIEFRDEVGSTNAELLREGSAPDRSVLVAHSQSAGRGRFDRSWTSPPGAGLTFSVLLRPAVPLTRWGWLPLLTGMALAEAVRDIAPGLGSGLKWPNDLLLSNNDADAPQKVAGILVQSSGDAVVLGVGVNVTTTAAELPVPTATSLTLCGATVTRAELLDAVLRRLDTRYAQWADVDGDAEACGLAAAYRAACLTIGQQVAVEGGAEGGATLSGRAVDVDAVGRLVVDVDGELHAVAAGDVTHLRARTAT